jgi:hypothetical protein
MSKTETALHNFIWPEGKFKDSRLVAVPQNYLKSFIEVNKKNKTSLALVTTAEAELVRRGKTPSFIHFTEHLIERFTERDDWVLGFVRYHSITHHGLASYIKGLFQKALDEGITTRADGNNGRNYNVRRKGLRWTYGLYLADPVKGYEYKLITVVPAKMKGVK